MRRHVDCRLPVPPRRGGTTYRRCILASVSDTPYSSGRTSVQSAAFAVGVIFLLVGILGFVPGVTSQYDQMRFAGHESGALLLGLFQVSILHNAVHLLFGVAGLVMARSHGAARSFLIGGGVIYLLLWLYGLFVDHASQANFVPLNDADDWLHFVLGIGMVGLGMILSRKQPSRPLAAR
jgi:hypothetical protein